MRLCGPGAALAAPAMLFLAALGDAAAQTVGYDIMRQGHASVSSEGRRPQARTEGSSRHRTSRAELPRGSKNIFRDEPGKIIGVPGVDDNPATDLPATRFTHTKKHSNRRARAHSTRLPVAENRELTSPQRGAPLTGEDASETVGQRSTGPETTRTPDPSVGSQKSPRGIERYPSAQADDAEVRAKIIADLAAKALAEEQQRLALERSRDRRSQLKRSSPSAPPFPEHDPATTAASIAGENAREAPLNSPPRSRSDGVAGVCRLLFFGVLPGC